MEDNEINKEERKLWAYFKKTEPKRNTPCLEDNALAAYLEGRHMWRGKGIIEEHLAACPACLEKFVEMRSLLSIDIEEVPFEVKQKAKGYVTVGAWKSDEGDIFSWGRLFQLKKSLAWGLVSLLIFTFCFTGLKLGGELALSSVMGVFSGQSNNSIESAIDLLGV